MRVLSIFGTRPEAIKLAPVVMRLSGDARFESRVCCTGQHRRMVEPILSLFGIKPDYDLRVMKPGQQLTDLTSRLLDRLGPVLDECRPDAVLVQGDTTTTLAAALTAFYRRIPIAHVEAGLRTPRLALPFPEEANRRIVTRLADLHFAPTRGNARSLLREGVKRGDVVVTGNTVIDALYWVKRRALARGHAGVIKRLAGRANALLDRSKRLILVTAHRRESFGAPLSGIFRALTELAQARPDVVIGLPAHLNPNVQAPARALLARAPNVLLMPPLDYESFVFLMTRCRFLLTDSGGIQEEAPALGKPVLVLRDVSERPEALAVGSALLVGTNPRRIMAESLRLLDDRAHYARMSRVRCPYGDGTAASAIIAALARRFRR